MRRSVVSALAVAASIGFVSSASAADMPVKAPVYKAPAPEFSWTGLYIGVNGGCGQSRSNPSAPFTDADPFDPAVFSFGENRGRGCFGGGQIGYNYQYNNNWVIGLEADAQLSSLKHSSNFTETEPGNTELPATWDSKLKSFGTVRARLGYATNLGGAPILPYVTAGWAWGRNEITGMAFETPAGPAAFSDTQTHFGWTVGVGLDVALSRNWFVRGEYLYVDLGSKTYNAILFDDGTVPGGNITDSIKAHLGRLAINYKF